MEDKTPGQIAFEAYVQWHGRDRSPYKSWQDIPAGKKAEWEYVGPAVAQAVAPIGL